ncbi:MAG TPA: hypothetical protein VFZ52_07605 [Chryseolinea sp.]
MSMQNYGRVSYTLHDIRVLGKWPNTTLVQLQLAENHQPQWQVGMGPFPSYSISLPLLVFFTNKDSDQ